MTTLIDRYVQTVLRRIPEQRRTDIDRELRASIEDAVEARVAGGSPPDAAVAATLLELGDPAKLADGYADRRQYLIGPDLFPAWRRLLLLLISAVLPVVVVVVTVLDALSDPSIGAVIGTAVSTTLTVGAHMAFWVTLVFAILDRTGVARSELPGPGRPWSLADLPRHERRTIEIPELAAGLIWPVLLIVALVLQQFTFTDVPVLDPDNWTFWWPYLVVVLILEAASVVWLYLRDGWSHTVTIVNAVLAVLFTGPLVWLLAGERFFNPAWVSTLVWDGVADPLAWLTGIILVIALAGAVHDVIDVAHKGFRARRGVPAAPPGAEHSR